MNGGDCLLPLIRRRTWRDRDPVPRLLREWYGEDVARDVIRDRLPHPTPLSEGIDQVLTHLVSPEELMLHQLRQDWPKLVGQPVARASEPHHLHRGVLYVTVRSDAMRMELDRFHRTAILAKVHAHSGENFCREIRFTAAS